MSIPVEALEAEFLRLPTSDRVRLLDRIIASLDAGEARDQAWDRLAAQRQLEVKDGSAVSVDGSDFIDQLHAELS